MAHFCVDLRLRENSASDKFELFSFFLRDYFFFSSFIPHKTYIKMVLVRTETLTASDINVTTTLEAQSQFALGLEGETPRACNVANHKCKLFISGEKSYSFKINIFISFPNSLLYFSAASMSFTQSNDQYQSTVTVSPRSMKHGHANGTVTSAKRSFTPLPYFDAQPFGYCNGHLSQAVSASTSFTENKDFSLNSKNSFANDVTDSVDDMSCVSDASWKQLNQVASIEEENNHNNDEQATTKIEASGSLNGYKEEVSENTSSKQTSVLGPRKGEHEDKRTTKRRCASASMNALDEREPSSTKRACVSQNEDRDLYCSLSMDSLDDGFTELDVNRSFSLKLKDDDVQDFISNGIGDRMPSWDIQGQCSFEGGFSITSNLGERSDSVLGTALTFGDEEDTNLFNFDEIIKSATPSNMMDVDSKPCASTARTSVTGFSLEQYPYSTYGMKSPNSAFSRQMSSSTQKTSNTTTTPVGNAYPFNGFMPMAFIPPHPGMARIAPHPVFMHASHPMQSPSNSKLNFDGTEGGGWSKTDDEKLTDILKKRTTKDWEVIAAEFGQGKTSKDCQERWIRYLKPGVRKGQWTDQEDHIVMETVTNSKEQPFTRWSDLAQKLPGRVGKQIRDRWVNHLNPHINHLPFTKEDDMLLYNGHKEHGKKWVEISSTCFNSTRSENQVKNRWYSASFKKFCDAEFGAGMYASLDKKAPKKSSIKGDEK